MADTPAFRCLNAAIAEGYSVTVSYDGEVDYKGRDASAAWQAVLDCTEPMIVRFYKPVPAAEIDIADHGQKDGWMCVVWQNEMDDFVDCSSGGYADRWFEANCAKAL